VDAHGGIEYYAYDNADRVTGACYGGQLATCPAGSKITYAYDKIRNRTSQTKFGTITTYERRWVRRRLSYVVPGTHVRRQLPADDRPAVAVDAGQLLERRCSRRFRRRAVYGAHVLGELGPVRLARVAEAVLDQVQHAGLDDRLRPDVGDRLRQPAEPVADDWL